MSYKQMMWNSYITSTAVKCLEIQEGLMTTSSAMQNFTTKRFVKSLNTEENYGYYFNIQHSGSFQIKKKSPSFVKLEFHSNAKI